MNKPIPASSSVLSFTIFLFFFFFLFSSSVSGFNITRLLNKFPEFEAFNNYITKTHLYRQINARQTITVLALDDSAVAAISGNSLDVIKQILSAHVILDYYDNAKFKKLAVDEPTVLTTMFQSTGDAVYQQGFVKVMHNKKGEIEFGSAGKNAPLTALFERSVASQPYNISVLQISSPIVVPGIGVYHLPPPAPEAPSPEPEVRVPAPAPADSSADAPSPAAKNATGSPAPAPSPADDDDTGSPADAPSPAADAPAPTADAPDAPASSPPKPADDAEDADAPGPADADDKAAATRGSIAGAGVVVAGLASLSLIF